MIALILAALGVLAIALLLFPVTIFFNSTKTGKEIDGSFRINWIIFILRYNLKEKQLAVHIFGRRMPSSPEKKTIASKPDKIRKSPGRMRPNDLFQIIGPLLRLIKDSVSSFRVKYYDIEVTFGHIDPAVTGILTGFMHTVCSSLGMDKNVKFAPDFRRTALEWNVTTEATITPIRMALPFARFAANRKVLRVMLQNIAPIS